MWQKGWRVDEPSCSTSCPAAVLRWTLQRACRIGCSGRGCSAATVCQLQQMECSICTQSSLTTRLTYSETGQWSGVPTAVSLVTDVEQLGRCSHRDTYLEQQQTEKIETEVRDVDRIRITKVYACCLGWPSGGVIRALQSDINICYPP